jgi:cell division control protein 6
MGRAYIEFPNYTIDQVSDILVRRSKEAFQENVIGTDILDWIAKIVVSPIVNGDIRYALDLLSYAGNLAESEGTERVLLDHVKKINKQTYNGITDEDIKELSKLQIIILLGIIKGLKIKNRDYVDLKDIRMQSLEISEKYKLRKLDVEDILDDLATRKIIKIISLKKISLISSSIENLEKTLLSKLNSMLDLK